MKLLRYGPAGQEKPGMLDADGNIRSLVGKIDDISGANLSTVKIAELKALDPASLEMVDGSARIGACLGQVTNLICIGLNFADHAAETGNPIPKTPVMFAKHTSTVTGPYDDIELINASERTDWEVELGVVIGQDCSKVSEEDAMDYVAGFFTANDVSERRLQKGEAGQWYHGKSPDNYAPIGPWVVTKDEVGDFNNLAMTCVISGTTRQNGNSKTMIFTVPQLVSYISQTTTLKAGDAILTGTPPGVGVGHNPMVFLKPGEEMVTSIEKLGEQRNKLV